MNKETKDQKYIELQAKFEEGTKNKMSAERNALININFINGKQNIRYNGKTNLVEEIPYDSSAEYKENESFNMIRPLRNTVITNIKDKIPVSQCIPRSQNDADIDAAFVTTSVLADLADKQKLAKKLKKVARDAVDIGPAFLHVK